MLNIENAQNVIEIDEALISKLNEALDKITEEEGVEYEPEVSVYFTDDEEIRKLNKEHRNIDSSTDVLSFPMLSYGEGETYGDIYTSEDELFDYMFEEDRLILGDVVISGDHAKAQAKEYGHSVFRETVFLFVHSLLHLLGYDHMDEDERNIMNKKEDYYMTRIGVERFE